MQELNSIREGKYWDDAKGGWLDPVLVRKAREEEMQYVKKHVVYEKVPISQCWKETGKNPIKTGWADTNKGTSECPNIRSRWVAKEYNTGPRPDLFSATSPLEGVKLVISEAASSNQKGTVLLVIDVRRAYFYAKARRRVYIELPEGNGGGPDSRQCGLLRKSLYGTRDAAQNWECELGGFLEEIGLRKGQASTCLYSEEARGISASVHGDDVTVKASREDAEWLIQEFKKRYEIKTQMIGEAADLDKQLQILNRTVRWSSRGLWIEADPRHVKEVIKALGLERATPAPTPGVVAKGETRVEDNDGSVDPELGPEETTMFRAVAARLNYLSQDRPDITFATMRLCSKMSRPDAQDLKNMKRVGRFLVGRPRVGCLFQWQAHPSALHSLADADWAGDRQSRKSVSGGMILHGKHLIKAWSKQQSIVATSTAEAELYAGNRAATESMGVQAFAKDLGRVVTIRLHIDSSAALSIISKTGLGKAKHIEIQHLWLQEAVRSGKLTVEKILTETNSSDLGTKHLTSERSEMLMRLVNCFYV